jgi:putative hydrolase of the HAD superfamily
MKKATPVTTLFTDIGGVLLTNGWDRKSRASAAEKFGLDLEELNERHHLTFDTYESGKLDLEEYLSRVVFYEKRPFARKQFRDFMFSRSKPYSEMIEMVRKIKEKYKIKVGVVSNEGRELNAYRIKKFGLGDFVDFFISSCYVHFRKPDADIFRVALDIAHVPVAKVVYLEDRSLFVHVAEGLGIRTIHHIDFETTQKKLSELGFKV